MGSHIKDAACYVCWAFSRVFNLYVADIASGMLTVTVFDREVNCNRATSAAFQENVGGIDNILTVTYWGRQEGGALGHGSQES